MADQTHLQRRSKDGEGGGHKQSRHAGEGRGRVEVGGGQAGEGLVTLQHSQPLCDRGAESASCHPPLQEYTRTCVHAHRCTGRDTSKNRNATHAQNKNDGFHQGILLSGGCGGWGANKRKKKNSMNVERGSVLLYCSPPSPPQDKYRTPPKNN